MKMPSQHSFSQQPRAEIPRSSFDRSHTYKTTFNSGFLYPIFTDEVLPGDTFSVNMTGFCRLSTPLKPLMDNAYMSTFFFFVPLRLIWDNFQKFMGEQRNPGDTTDYLVPQVDPGAPGFLPGEIGDYLGLPLNVPNLRVSAFYHRGYNLIYNEWFRDENLINSLTVPTTDGPDVTAGMYALRRRGKRHDYFTSCLPWPQKSSSISIPVSNSVPVIALGNKVPTFNTTGNAAANYLNIPASGNATTWANAGTGLLNAQWLDPKLGVDLSAAAGTINQLRQAFQIQKLYERDARGGTRYTEIIRAHFGVTSPDARLQRPEYLGGGQSPVLVSQVPQTGGTGTTGTTTPQGNLAAFGTSTMRSHGFTKSFTEHGVIIGLLSVRADLTYQRCLERMYSRRTRFDFFWPALAHIGEQAVLSKEIYCDGTAGDDTVFGYQERYAEYRYKPSRITGQFRSTSATPLDVWHLSQAFAARPVLNQAFIEENPPFARVVAVPSEPTFIGDFFFQQRCARPMPVYGVPGLVDHF